MRFTNLAFTLLLCLSANAVQGQKKIILGAYNAQVSDAVVGSITPNDNWGTAPSIDPYTWTQGGVVNVVRPLIRFDLSALPDGAKIKEVLLVLYYDPFTHGGKPHAGTTAFSVSRITEPWEELGVTWDNQPAITAKNQVAVPLAAYDQQNYVINVTELVKDMFAESPPKNYGFMLRLDEEIIFNAVYLASSNNADLSRRPQLWITYDDGLVGAGSSGLSASGVHFSVAPNPSSGVFSVTMEGDFSAEKYEAEVFDLQGKTLLKQPLTGSFSYLYANRLPAGTYLLQIRGDGGYVQQTKIVLTK